MRNASEKARLVEGSGPAVLVVEEDAFLGAMLEDVLRVEGYNATLIVPTLDALNDTRRPDVVIVAMPSAGFPGTDLLAACRERWPIAKTIAIVPAAFGVGPDTLVAECIRGGATYVIGKPFQCQDILRKVASLVPWN